MKKCIFTFCLMIMTFFVGINNFLASNSNNLLETETKDKVIFIKDDEKGNFNYSWTFDKESYKKNKYEFDLIIKFNTNNEAKINKLIGKDEKKQFISFNYFGDLPSVATLKLPVSDNFEDEDILKLYSYDNKTNNIKLVNSNIKVVNGYVTFEINRCTDYFLTLSNINMSDSKANNGLIIVAMMIIITALIGYTLFNNKD